MIAAASSCSSRASSSCGQQQLGCVLARSRLPDQVGDDPEQRAQEPRCEDARRRAARQRHRDAQSDPDRSAERETEHERQAGDRHPDGCTACEIGCPARLQRDERNPGRPHRRDHRSLNDGAPRRERVPDRESESDREHRDRDGDSQPCSVGCRSWMAVDRRDHDDRDQDEPERAQRPALTRQPALGPGVRVRDPRGLFAHDHRRRTIERRPARRNGPDATQRREARHALARTGRAAIVRRPRSCTVTIRVVTSQTAIATSATGHAAAPI